MKRLPLEVLGRLYRTLHLSSLYKNFFKDPFHLRVLAYHDIQDKGKFEEQIRFIRSVANMVAPEQVKRFFDGREFLTGLNVFITFDDGSADQYEAADFLDRYNIKACFFIATGDVGETRLRSREHTALTPMTWEQIADLAKRGHAIGAHTVTHANLAQLQPAEARREMLDSKLAIEQHIGQAVSFFAFPYGTDKEISQESLLIAKDMFPLVCTFLSGKNYFGKTSPFVIRRSGVNPPDSLDYVQALLLGWKDFMYKKRLAKLDSFV